MAAVSAWMRNPVNLTKDPGLFVDGQALEPDAVAMRRWPRVVPDRLVRVAVTIPGDPLSKQRPRLAVNRNGGVYTPVETREAEERVKQAIRATHSLLVADGESAFGMRLSFHTRTYQRRDVDNMVKLVADACTGVVWLDDSQVEEMHARVERRAAQPRTEALMYVVGRAQRPVRACALCQKIFRMYPSLADRKYCSKKCADRSLQRRRPVVCAHCDTQFERVMSRPPAGEEFCSRACRTAHAHRVVRCDECEREFERAAAYVKPRNYCSRECSVAAAVKRRMKTLSGTGTCVACGGRTSKKRYSTCMACQIRLRREPERRR